MASTRPQMQAGRNIAMKVPPGKYDETVAFYRDVIGLQVLDAGAESSSFRFGWCRLWIDRVVGINEPQVWLELQAEDTKAAAEHLAAQGMQRCDEVEPLPEGFDGFWIKNPAGIVHLISNVESDE